jgi:hypothetical protein
MTPQEQRMLAEVLRRLAAYMAERRILITILKEAVRDNRSPQDWEKELHRLRETPEYHAFLEQFEPIFSQLDQAADLEELMPLIQKIIEGKAPN